jgi:hypothetical protein
VGKIIDITGNKYGKWAVERFAYVENRHSYWLCRCECGTTKVIWGANLRQGLTHSCGCSKIVHGLRRTNEYRTWRGIKERCLNPNNKDYINYGGRGITVCERWVNSFENFIKDMGKKPSPELSIDRINNDKGYSPDNCQWATKSQQSRNQRKRTK